MVERRIDSHKLIYHPERVSEWTRTGDCFPIYVEIGPTTRCNHRCVFCALDWLEHKPLDIDKEVLGSALEDMARSGVKSIMFAGEGEPLLHRDISYFVQKAKTSGISVAITTNGVPLTERKTEELLPYLSWIRFSVDAGTPETYTQIHRTRAEDFERVTENVKYLVETRNRTKSNTNVGIQFLLMPTNIGEVEKFVEHFKALGVDNVQIKPYSKHPKSDNNLVVSYQDYQHLFDIVERFNSGDFTVFFRRETMQRLADSTYDCCHGLSFFTLVDARGNVIPCNMFYESESVYGNLYEQSFSQIWNGEKRKEVLKKLREIGTEGCRRGCRLDAINRYLAELKDLPDFANFI